MSTAPALYATDVTSERRSARRQPTERLSAFQVCLVLFLGANAFSGYRFGLPLPIGPDRILFGLFLSLMVVDRRIRWRTWRPTAATWVALAALLWATLSALQHGTLFTRLGQFALLDRLAVPYLLFVLAPVALSTRRSRVLLLQFLCLLGIYLGLLAIFEVLGPHSLVYPQYIIKPGFGVSYGRAQGPLGAADANAVVMAAIFFSSLALRSVTTGRVWRVLTVVSALLSLDGVLLALTRAEWIGTALAIIVTGLIVPFTRRKLPAFLLALAIAIAAALAASPPLRDTITTRTTTTRTVYDRQNTNAGGLRAVEAHPLFGIGWSEFLAQSNQWVRQSPKYPLTHTDIEIHNVPLSRAAELGLLGGGLWALSVFVGPVAAMFKRRRQDRLDEAYRVVSVGVGIVWLIAIQFSPFASPLPTALVWLLAGIVFSPLVRSTDPRAETGSGRQD